MSFADVATSFRLSEDYPKYRMQNWELQELYQRSLDRERVHEISAKYLQSGSGRPAFFNSLTVALTAGPDLAPLSPSVLNFPSAKKTYSLPGLALAVQRTEQIDGVEVPASAAFGKVAWVNSDEMLAVAIDGQHRLAAIQKFAELNRQQASASFVSVIVVLFNSAVGYKSAAIASPVEAMRSVFIDLNKHAVPVSTARNLLLDDASAHAACVRSLMSKQLALSSEELGGGTNKLGRKRRSLGEFERSVPLALVDWHGENKSKIDEGPYVTSVLALNWWALRLLKANGKKFQWKLPGRFDPDAEFPYRAFMDIAKKVGLPPKTMSRIAESENAMPRRSFHFTDEEVKKIGEAFGQRWGGAVVTLLCTLTPYRRVIEKREASGSIEPKFSQWYQCYDDFKPFAQSQSGLAKEFQARLESVVQELQLQGISADDYKRLVDELELMKKKSLFFLLVAQRALLIAFIDMLGETEQIKEMSKILGDTGSEVAEDPMCVIARYLVTALNAIDARKPEIFTRELRVASRTGARELSSFSDRFWAGSVLNPSAHDQVDFSEAAAKRTALWLQLMAHLYWIEKSRGKKSAAKTAVDSHLNGSEIGGGVVGTMCAAALTALLPPIRSVRNPPKFYESPANFLAQLPDRVSDSWRNQRQALAQERLAVITDAVRVAVG